MEVKYHTIYYYPLAIYVMFFRKWSILKDVNVKNYVHLYLIFILNFFRITLYPREPISQMLVSSKNIVPPLLAGIDGKVLYVTPRKYDRK